MRFANRRQAGEKLGEMLVELSPLDPVVLGLPRGGVPVAASVAAVLGCRLDVLIVRKLGVPWQPELAMGAIGESGAVYVNERVIQLAGVDHETFESVVRMERAEMERRARLYRPGDVSLDPSGKTALVVDDGLATGATARAAVAVLRERRAGSIWVCVPVAPADTTAALRPEVDRVVVVHQPHPFGAVGAFYRDFTQTSDEEVRGILAGYGGADPDREVG